MAYSQFMLEMREERFALLVRNALGPDDTFDGADVLPGFTLPLVTLFPKDGQLHAANQLGPSFPNGRTIVT